MGKNGQKMTSDTPQKKQRAREHGKNLLSLVRILEQKNWKQSKYDNHRKDK